MAVCAGGLTLISFLVQLITGILLVFFYDPSPEGAYNSVDYITYQLPLGWLVRGVHHYGASAMVILVVLHMLRTYFYYTYKRPREINWLTGVFLLFVTLSFGFTGYLLPWDQKGYWATKVGTEIAGSVPGVGGWLLHLMRGGENLGQATLTRFYATHIMLLPAVIMVLIATHVFQLRFHGMAAPITERAKQLSKKFVPFFPHLGAQRCDFGPGLAGAVGLSELGLSRAVGISRRSSQQQLCPPPRMVLSLLFSTVKIFSGFVRSGRGRAGPPVHLWEPAASPLCRYQ